MKKIFLFIVVVLLSCKSKEALATSENQKQALQDIKADSVKVFTFGLPFISPIESERKANEIKQNKISNVYRKYGLYRKNMGCVVNTKEDKSRKEYHKITDAYLEERNGKAWKKKLEKEINNIIEN